MKGFLHNIYYQYISKRYKQQKQVTGRTKAQEGKSSRLESLEPQGIDPPYPLKTCKIKPQPPDSTPRKIFQISNILRYYFLQQPRHNHTLKM
jgi:hypothetical protein